MPVPGPRNVPRLHWFLLASFALLWLVMAWEPLHRDDWLLENYLVFLTVPVVLLTYRRFRLDDASYVLLFVFVSLHVIGSHWTYGDVPIPWRELGWERNHYDRIVHTCFGLLLAVPLARVLQRLSGVTPGWAAGYAVMGVFAFSSIYEIVEWLAAEIVAPDVGQAFLGTQGDEWDAIKDMFLAGMGSIAAVVLDAAGRRMRRRVPATT